MSHCQVNVENKYKSGREQVQDRRTVLRPERKEVSIFWVATMCNLFTIQHMAAYYAPSITQSSEDIQAN